MEEQTPIRPRPSATEGKVTRQRPRASALRAAAALGPALAVAMWVAGTHPVAAFFAVLLYAAVCLVAVAEVEKFHPFPRFGPANVVTLLRAGLACLIAAMVLTPASSRAWWLAIFLLAIVALALDGVDGWASRRTRLTSAFGARFDMEVDALLILILSISAALNGKAGAWLLLLGLIRYLFVAARLIVPALRRPLPPSRRRKAVCVLQVSTLGLLLLPALAAPVSSGLAFVALTALVWSFAVDIRWLLGFGQEA